MDSGVISEPDVPGTKLSSFCAVSEPFAAGNASSAIGIAIRNVESQIISFDLLCMGSVARLWFPAFDLYDLPVGLLPDVPYIRQRVVKQLFVCMKLCLYYLCMYIYEKKIHRVVQ